MIKDIKSNKTTVNANSLELVVLSQLLRYDVVCKSEILGQKPMTIFEERLVKMILMVRALCSYALMLTR
jgi:hypothetical protein